MWQEYKKRFVMTQVVVAIILLIAWQYGMERRQIVMAFIAMEVGAVFGAIMGARLKSQVERARDDDLPLSK